MVEGQTKSIMVSLILANCERHITLCFDGFKKNFTVPTAVNWKLLRLFEDLFELKIIKFKT